MDASAELIRAMLDLIRANSTITNLVPTQKINDRQPAKDGKPANGYPAISLGPSVSIRDDFDCIDGEELTIQFDVWTHGDNGAFGSADCRAICSALKRALHNADIALSVNALVTLTWELTRVIPDPNPAIRHGIVQFTAVVETP